MFSSISIIHSQIQCIDISNFNCDSSYDGVAQCIPDAFSYLLEEMHRLEMDLGHLPQKWRVLWDKLELPPSETLTVSQCKSNFNAEYLCIETLI